MADWKGRASFFIATLFWVFESTAELENKSSNYILLNKVKY